MVANFPGAGNAVPGAYVETSTLSAGASIPSGSRIALLIGEGARHETVVSSAVGGGNDGLNSAGTSTSGADGRHFNLAVYPVISNRTQLYKNGIPLVVLEEAPDSNTFDNRYDARVDITTGFFELQRATLVDQGGSYYTTSSSNVGTGTISDLALTDSNAPAETWTVRCSSIRRDGYGDPVDGYAVFTVRGTVSGVVLDGYGNQITWQSDGVLTSNGILEFSINEGLVAFREGDNFTVQVAEGGLVRGDTLTAVYIGETDINDPEYFSDINLLTSKHGYVSLQNRLSLGAQLSFANGTPGIYTIEAAPSLPRRNSYSLVESADGLADIDDLTFALPFNIVPDVDSNIHFFVTDPTTGVETQIVPNKTAFYNASITSNTSSFAFGVSYTYSYTVVLEQEVVKSGLDGVITPVTGTTATLSSSAIDFNIDDLSGTRTVTIVDSASNDGTFTIVSVSNGVVTISDAGGFIAESSVQFQVIDSAYSSARILFTDDLALTLGQSLRCTVVDQKDADFFDAGWINAYAAAETVDVDMVTPLPSQTISVIFQNGKTHVETQSYIKNKHERVLLIGAIKGLTPDNVIGTTAAAVDDIGVLEGIQGDDVSEILAGNIEDLTDYGVQNAFGDSFRVVFFYPDEIVVQVGSDNQKVDGFFLAAAAAGYFSGVSNINIPLTNKRLSGFSILRDKLFAPLVIENLAASGIVVLQPVIGGGRVIWGKTTTNSGFAEEEEISIIFIRDRIAKSLRGAFGGFVGVAETPTFQATLFARAIAAMQAFLSQRLITSFKNLTVVRDSVEPRQWNITVAVQPVYPTNWIFCRVNIGIV